MSTLKKLLGIVLAVIFISLASVPIASAAQAQIIQIATNGGSCYALYSNGSLYAWGGNGNGQLGLGTRETRYAPVLVGTGFTEIAVANDHVVALKESDLYAWGFNAYGAVGDGTGGGYDKTAYRASPVHIGSGYSKVMAFGNYSFAVKGGALYGWGANVDQRLIAGDDFILKPTKIAEGITDVIRSGLARDYLYVLKNKNLYQFKAGALTLFQSNITQVVSDEDGTHWLALNGDMLYAWGSNIYGTLGDGTSEGRAKPCQIGSGYNAIAAGSVHSLALKSGALYAWGANNFGQLGSASTSNTPVKIGDGYRLIAAGGLVSLGVKDNTLYAWGLNTVGQLGIGANSPGSTATPVKVLLPDTSDPSRTELKFGTAEIQIGVGNTASATVSLYTASQPINFDGSVTWTSSNPGVARVADASDGIIFHTATLEGVSSGTCALTARMDQPYLGQAYSATVQVIVGAGAGEPEVTSVKINKTRAAIQVGNTVQLKGTALPAKARDKILMWSSENEGVATVDPKGKVTALETGETTVTAMAKSGVSAVCTVTVTRPKIARITTASAAIDISEPFEVQYTCAPANADKSRVGFLSSNAKVATVDSKGLVTPVGRGVTRITLTSLDNPKVKTSRTLYVGRNKALLIGLSEYKKVSGGKDADLPSKQDLADVKAMLGSAALDGIPFTYTTLEKASWLDMSKAVLELVGDTTEFDTVLFFFAGHGARNDDAQYHGALAPNLNPADGAYSLPMLKTHLDTAPGKKIVILTSCYSGHFIDYLGPEDLAGGYLVLTATNANEKGKAYNAILDKYNPFTKFLTGQVIKEFKKGHKELTLGALWSYVSLKLRERGIPETPQCFGPSDGILFEKKGGQ